MTLTERIDIQQLAASDPDFMKLHQERCRREPAYFINTCLNIFEPRETQGDWSDIPYLLRAFQEDTVIEIKKRIDSGKDLLIDKTREMGATWLVLAVYLHSWLFEDKFTAIVSSITEQKIDHKGNPSCLLWKFDYMVDSLKVNAPYFFIEEYRELTSGSITHMKRLNPRNKSLINGEVMGPNLGRSGRCKTMFLDEFAEAASPAAAFASSSRTSPCRIFVFTPKGMNFAGRLAVPKRGEKRVMARISLHWKIDPTKNRWEYRDNTGKILDEGNGEVPVHILAKHGHQPVYPWYKDACARLGNDRVSIAQELDIDYNQSYEGQMYPQIDRARISSFVYDPVLPLYCSMDYGLDDMTALIWWQWSAADRRIRVLDAYQNRGKTIRWYIPFLVGHSLGLGESEGGYSEYDLEVIKRHAQFGQKTTEFFGDPAGRQRNQVTATSVIQVLSEYNIYVRTNSKSNANHVRKFALQCLLPYCDFNDGFTDDVVQAIRDSRLKPTGEPIHGPESHFRTAAEYFAVNQPHGLIGADGMQVTEYDLAHLEKYETIPSGNDAHSFMDAATQLSLWEKRAKALDELEEAVGLSDRGRVAAGGWGRRRRR